MSDQQGSGEPGDGGRSRRKVRVHIDDELKHGQYANLLVVRHTAHEFTFDFCQMQPGGDADETRAEVVSRVRVPPTLIGQILESVNTNLTAYEERYGMVRRL